MLARARLYGEPIGFGMLGAANPDESGITGKPEEMCVDAAGVDRAAVSRGGAGGGHDGSYSDTEEE